MNIICPINLGTKIMRPTIRSVTVSFCLMLGLASYSVVNAGDNGTRNVAPTIVASK